MIVIELLPSDWGFGLFNFFFSLFVTVGVLSIPAFLVIALVQRA